MIKLHHGLRQVIAVLILAFYAVDALVSPGRLLLPATATSSMRTSLSNTGTPTSVAGSAIRKGGGVQVRSSKNDNNNEDEAEESYFSDQRRSRFRTAKTASSKNSTTASTSHHANYLDDLTPPPINWARDSILFSENPATARNNGVVETWRLCKEYLPPVFTGTWSWRDTSITDRNPLGAIYNMLVVRIPTMGIGFVYIKNLTEGHPLIMDIGQGAFEMSPVVVLSVLALILA
jgi:hypothetical protein